MVQDGGNAPSVRAGRPREAEDERFADLAVRKELESVTARAAEFERLLVEWFALNRL